MTFLWPQMLLAILAVPLLVLLRATMRRRSRSRAVQMQGLALAPSGTANRGSTPDVGWILFLIAVAVLSVALARPQATVNLPRLEGTVILAFDVSGSMAATDFEPTRLESAKQAAQAFVDKQPPGVQIGVVAFSDSGFSVQAPTNDEEIILGAIDRLSPERGTSLANGILVSLNTIAAVGQPDTNYYSNRTPTPQPTPTPLPQGQYSSAAIVLLSDGENNERPDPMTAAQLAAQRGVRIYTIGLGSPGGALLHLNGLTIRSRLNEPMLQDIADETGGSYYNAPTADELKQIYENLTPQLALRPENTELTALFAAGGTVILLAAALATLLRSGRLP
jgi:Ca-activated chloride channel family protein